MTDTTTCQQCGSEIDLEEDDYGIVEDPHALYSGYNLRLHDRDGPAEDGEWAVCEHCNHELGSYGETYVIAAPRYADDPEAGDVRTVSGMVSNGVLISRDIGKHDGVEPESPEFEIIKAMVTEEEIPTEYLERFEEIPDGAEWESIGTGWHSSLEQSDISEAVNAITSGELGIYGPVIVKFGQTNNVCTVGLSLWAPEGLQVWSKEAHEKVTLREYLSGKHSAPGGAFTTN